MSTKTTYKQTELGLIPDDWEVKKLKDVSNVIMGQSPDSKNYFEYEVGLPLLQGNADIKERKSIKRIWTNQITKICEADDIIMSVRAPVGSIAKASFKSCIGRGICSIQPNNSIIKKFLYFYLEKYETNWIKFCQGSTFESINSDDIRNLKIPLPPLPEQKKIADCLSTWDVAIEKQNALINALTDRKKALMQQLLTGKKRLPGFSGEWKEVSLIELADFRRGSFPQPYGLPEWYDNENGEPFIQVYDVGDNFNLKPTTKSKISELAQVQSVFIKKGTLIVTLQGSIGKVAITNYDAYIDRTLLLFSSFKMKVDIYFIMYQIHNLFNIEKEKAPGGIIKTITKEVLSNFKIKLPSFEEQTAIAEILATADRELQLQKEKLAQLQTQKKGLMQVLLTGKKRLIN